MRLCFFQCRWQVFVPCGSVLIYQAPASVCQNRCSWLMILQHLCQFPSLSICHWCPPVPLEGQLFFHEVWKSLCTKAVSPEVIECVSLSCSSLTLAVCVLGYWNRLLCLWTFLSALSIARAICLAWLKFNFFPPINACKYGCPWHLQAESPLTYPR